MRPILVLGIFGAALCLPTETHGQSCSLPGKYAHFTSQIEDSILITLATESDKYAIGDSIACYLLFENLGDSTYAIPNPWLITPLWSFWIFPDSCSSTEQGDCLDETLFLAPEGRFFFGVPVVLDPGDCVSYELTWDGIADYATEVTPGSYAVVAAMEASLELFPVGGIRLNITIDGTVRATPTSWGKIKSMYGRLESDP